MKATCIWEDAHGLLWMALSVGAEVVTVIVVTLLTKSVCGLLRFGNLNRPLVNFDQSKKRNIVVFSLLYAP